MFDLTNYQTILLFAVFIVILFAAYKIFKIILKAGLVMAIAFSFPWVVKFLGLQLPITANISTGIQFAFLGLGLFLVYEFFHFITHFFKILAWPFKVLFRSKEEEEHYE